MAILIQFCIRICGLLIYQTQNTPKRQEMLPKNSNPKRSLSQSDVLEVPKIRARPLESIPLNIIHIIHTHKLKALAARGALELNSRSRNTGNGDDRRLASLNSLHAAEVLVALVAWRPGSGAAGGGLEAVEDVELAAARDDRCVVRGEVEVEFARLAGGGWREVEGQESGNVGGLAVLEDLALGGVEGDCAGRDGVLRAVGWAEGGCGVGGGGC